MNKHQQKIFILDIFILIIAIIACFIMFANKVLAETVAEHEENQIYISEDLQKVKNENLVLKQALKEAKEIKDLLFESNYIGEFTITHYTASLEECGKTDGITKSGTMVQDGQTIATDWNILPVGTRVWIEGYGIRVVEDTGSAIRGNDIDVYVNTTHEEALKLGVKQAKVYILN